MDQPSTTPHDTEPAAAPVTPTATRSAMIVRFALAMLWTLVIMGLCWMPGGWVQQVEEESSWFEIPNLDKVVHWGIFVVFAVLWLRAVATRWRYAWVALGGLALAAITELVQNLPAIGRDGEMGDVITDLIGLAIGLAVAARIEPLLGWLESRVLRPFGS